MVQSILEDPDYREISGPLQTSYIKGTIILGLRTFRSVYTPHYKKTHLTMNSLYNISSIKMYPALKLIIYSPVNHPTVKSTLI